MVWCSTATGIVNMTVMCSCVAKDIVVFVVRAIAIAIVILAAIVMNTVWYDMVWYGTVWYGMVVPLLILIMIMILIPILIPILILILILILITMILILMPIPVLILIPYHTILYHTRPRLDGSARDAGALRQPRPSIAWYIV